MAPSLAHKTFGNSRPEMVRFMRAAVLHFHKASSCVSAEFLRRLTYSATDSAPVVQTANPRAHAAQISLHRRLRGSTHWLWSTGWV